VVNNTAESQDAVQLSGFDGDSSCALAEQFDPRLQMLKIRFPSMIRPSL